MVDAIGEADLRDEPARARRVRPRLRFRRNERGNENVLEHRALRQEAVILEDETDLPVAERGERVRWELERIAPVERHTPGGRRLERAEDVEQRALAAPRRSHDR